MLKLYNTLSKKIEEFKPLNDNEVRMYTCGPTVYNYAHIGNLRTYIFEDLLKRVLLYNGYTVNHAMNITDVGHLVSDADEGEDKMEVGAKREGKNPSEIAKFYTDKFFQDTDELNIIKPNQIKTATETIDAQKEIIEILIEKGFTYEGEQAIYFDTSKFPKYGELSGQKISQKETKREGVIIDKDKKHQADFALWFFLKGRYKKHILHWPSPPPNRELEFNEGFPGWHIECSAISRELLGQPFDIHCGGVDHIGTHHSNEIAQSEAAFDKPLAKFWMHGEFMSNIHILDANSGLNVQLENNTHVCPFCGYRNLIKDINGYLKKEDDDEVVLMVKCKRCGKVFSGMIKITKMSKSKDNFITLGTLKEKGFSPLDFRYLCLTAHYRTQLNFTWEALEAAHKALEKLRLFFTSVIPSKTSNLLNKDIQDGSIGYRTTFKNVINANLNLPQALALAWELIEDKTISDFSKRLTLLKFDEIFGLNLANPALQVNVIDDVEVNEFVVARQLARDSKDFKKSDELRKQIEALGYEVMDTPEGQKIRKKLIL